VHHVNTKIQGTTYQDMKNCFLLDSTIWKNVGEYGAFMIM
jgi:hypothetical protein